MLKIDRDKHSFSVLEAPTLADVSITERYDLQEFISNSPDDFFQEIDQKLFLIGKELVPSKDVQDRIDLLAVDKEGTCVVIELKRGNHKLQMLQAISYAAMISHWESDDFLGLLDDDRQEALSDFLEVDTKEINREQRIILLAEAYDYALLVGAEWLSEQYGVDIMCCRVAMATDAATSSEYLFCSSVYPPPELSKAAVPRRRKPVGSFTERWQDWDEALSNVTNASVVSFFKAELTANRDAYLPRRQMRYRCGGRQRWFVAARKDKAYVWQRGRFEGDVDFWRHGLSKPDEVKQVNNDECLRLNLYTSEDFEFFRQAETEKLPSSEWFHGSPEEELEEAEVE